MQAELLAREAPADARRAGRRLGRDHDPDGVPPARRGQEPAHAIKAAQLEVRATRAASVSLSSCS